MSNLRRIGTISFNFLQDAYIAAAMYGMSRELARRGITRGTQNYRWFTADEAVVAEALSWVIVPSDEESPGIEDVDVLDPPAIVTLDNLISKSPDRQRVYSRGLLSFDIWAQHTYGSKFADLSKADQINLFEAAESIYKSWTTHGSAMNKAWRRLRAIAKVKNGSFFASRLYPQIREDCLQVFYTSRVSWVWLGYDGPPMEKGYSNLLESREP